MKRSFEYLQVVKSMESLDVEDVGNTCLNVLNDFGAEWYLLIRTECGLSTIETFGPFLVDTTSCYKCQFNYNYLQKGYDEKFLVNTIERFLNDPKKVVTQAFLVDEAESAQRLIDLFNKQFLETPE